MKVNLQLRFGFVCTLDFVFPHTELCMHGWMVNYSAFLYKHSKWIQGLLALLINAADF